MTSPVGLLTTVDAVWCSRFGVLSRTPADGSASVDVLGHIDDRVVTLADGREVEVSTMVSEMFADALHDAGAHGGDHDLVLVHPPHWGAVRCSVLTAAARPLGRDVLLVSSALVARDAAQSARPCPCGGSRCRTVVLDRTPHRTTVSTVVSTAISSDVVDCVLTDPTIGGDDELTVSRTRSAVDGALAAAPACRLVVHGTSDTLPRAVLDEMSDLTVVTVDDEEMAAAVVPSAGASPSAPPVTSSVPAELTPGRTGAWLAERAAAAAVDRRRATRRPVLVAAVATALVCVSVGAAALTSGKPPAPATEPPRAAQPSMVPAGPTESLTVSTAVPTTSAVPAGADFSVAGTHLTVPVGWHVEPGTERVEIRPDTPAGMRLVMVVRELDAGVGLSDVQATLSARVDAAPDRLDGLDRRSDVADRPALVYTETASDGSTVAWTVIVSPGEQTSLGCQSAEAANPVMAEVCTAVLASLVVG
ncbi:type VII secretion-associated protein [Rhodococcus sp. BP-349]|uniref:type VII secretion-associated protein n=1 Tax=unclassified Rhodococcus (in: high G+C Gram-positive bacteria) TaxID=192944 RepID=UPI001C9A5A03|nr:MULTISPECIES: type VII secretion-associated protein [unclassified Rhodococcus (in: high G+C Gram-positive bacteria)]MBY6538718.1 type VII secretion-associated protein [Rhodococcus sp. BP-363]MBY6543055.1 type VII secretion-associated protein [Rhodococcus sp. BP-369]MBY6562285.1 type VII secretion-associated protein [Rhodococcus sp. BP-370]MBY6576577.1 type VII secretion-associated protein [Rhodococcus sp. BP-364]MBY6585878.1 type VII secretion-associated protein [Rhodococcus sp. BP-358]